jgi:uncharacterized membrane protein
MALTQNIKLNGMVGSLLLLVPLFVRGIGFYLNVLGFVLLLLAVYRISRAYGAKKIFSQYLVFFILVVLATAASRLLAEQIPVSPEEPGTLLLVADIALSIIPTIGAFFLMRSFRAIELHTGAPLFKGVGVFVFVITLLIMLSSLYLVFADSPQSILNVVNLLRAIGFLVIPILYIIAFSLFPSRVSTGRRAA